MIKASTVTLYLSQSTIDLIDPTPTLATAITRYLNAIATHIAPEISTLVLTHNPNVLGSKVTIILGADPHNLLLRATLSNPSLSLNSAVDILLERFVPKIRNLPLSWVQNSLEPLSEEHYSQIKLEYGCLVPLRRESGKEYWYWRYQQANGKQRDRYIKGSLDRVLAHVDRVKIPRDARPKRLGKSRKIWEVKIA